MVTSLMIIIISFFMLQTVVAPQTSRPQDAVVFRSNIITSCTAYDGSPGTCLLITNCEEFHNLKVSSDQELVQIMKKSGCGFEGQIIKVCCPARNDNTSTKFLTPGMNPGMNLGNNVQCGQTSYTDVKITGGRNATLGVWKWMAAIGFNSTYNTILNFICGGSLITDRFVLTAAHCFQNSRFTAHLVRFGELDLNDNVNDGAQPIDILIQNITIHQDYRPNKLEDDIALIRLQSAVQFNDHIQPICLPAPEMVPDLMESLKPIVIGWGENSYQARLGPKTTHLQETSVYIKSKELCRRNYSEFRNAVIDHRVLCAGFGRQDACTGDSGGPLMRPLNYTFYVIGVVSYAFECALENYPGVYTNVSAFLPWIYKNIRT